MTFAPKYPPLKYPGGKTKLTPILRDILPTGERLVEPFVGSGAAFLNLHDRYKSALLNDSNPYSMGVLEVLKSNAFVFWLNCNDVWNVDENSDDLRAVEYAKIQILDA